VNRSTVTQNMAGWLKDQILSNTRVIKYGIVGFTGVAVNLSALALLFTLTSQRGWIPSTVANVISTVTNFVLHNLWTFSDRQHQGVRLVRGFLYFALTSLLSISVTTLAYVGFTRLAGHLPIVGAHQGSHQLGLAIALACQFVAILLGAAISYTLNREFTWAAPKETIARDIGGVTEI
jgi:putative flippase GtrA